MRIFACLIAAMASVTAGPAAGPEPLFRPAPRIPEPAPSAQPGFPGRHLVVLRPGILPSGEPVVLNLLPGISLLAVPDRLEERSSGSATWIGRIPAAVPGSAVLVTDDGRLTGFVRAGASIFRVVPAGDGLHAVSRVPAGSFPPEAPPLTPDPDGLDTPEALSGVGAGDGETVDVLVVYTFSAARASPDIRAEIQLAVDETNLAYARSGIRQRIRLAGVAQVGYRESGDLVKDLRQITLTDGVLDQVHALRDAACADLVSLWVEDGSLCGAAWHMIANPILFGPFGYSVVRRDCATGNLTFGHELGHNMGSLHDRFVTPVNKRFPAGHGLVHPDPVDVKRWRTIMAFDDECLQAAGLHCPRIPRFTNPEIRLRGDPTGVPAGDPRAADNALTFSFTAPVVAGLRNSAFCREPREIDCEPWITRIRSPGGETVAHLRDRSPQAGRHASFIEVAATLRGARPGSCPAGTRLPAEIALSVVSAGRRILPRPGTPAAREMKLAAGGITTVRFRPVIYTMEDCAVPGEEGGAVSISATATILEGADAGDHHARMVRKRLDCAPPGIRRPSGGGPARPAAPSGRRTGPPAGAGSPPVAP